MFSLTVLATAVMKADGRIMRSELNFVKEFLKRNFGLESTREAMSMLKELCNREIPLEKVCNQIRDNMDGPSRTQLLYFLFAVSLPCFLHYLTPRTMVFKPIETLY